MTLHVTFIMWFLWIILVSCSHPKDFAEPLKAVCFAAFAGLWMPGYWPCDGKSEAKFECSQNIKNYTPGKTSKRFRESERMLKCVANSDNHWGSCCKTTEKFQSAAPVSGLPGVALYPSLVYFWDLLSISECSHDMWWGVGWRAMSVSGVKSLFFSLEMFGANHELRMVGLGGAVAWRPQGKFMQNWEAAKGILLLTFRDLNVPSSAGICAAAAFWTFPSEARNTCVWKNVLDWSLAALFRACLALAQDWRVELRLCAWMFGPYTPF